MAEQAENDPVEVEVEEEVVVEEDLEALEETTDWKAKAQEIETKRREDGIRARERTRLLKAELAKTKLEPKVEAKSKTSELDDTQLDYLDLKGITEQDDIDVIQKVIQRTGITVRQALKDDYVVAKLASLKADRDVKAATPSSSKRAGSQGSNLDALIAKAERTGELPDDFETRTAVLNAITNKTNTNKPAWHRN